jgi:hypothetical protein
MTSNPLDDLRQINREQREAQQSTDDTVLREAVLTDGSVPALPYVREEGREEVRKGGSTALRPQGRKHSRTEGRKAGREEVREEALQAVLAESLISASTADLQALRPDLRVQVRETVSEKRIYQGGVKATLDLAPDLSTRFKRYSIDHHNVTLRQMMTELLNAYLSGEGY